MTDTSKAATRRELLRCGLQAGIAAAAVVAVAQSAAAADQDKIAQELVQYRATPNPEAPANLCSKCVNFVAPAACTIVAGTIAPNGWCVAFAPKDA